jgi:transcriptional regulator with XRE-family HTH domain
MISGDLIREARRRAGLTQRQLAERAGKAPSVIGRWERGEVKPPLETVVELIRACGLDLGFGIYESDDGHDLALIQRELRRTPAERSRHLATAVRRVRSLVSSFRGN